MNMKKKYWEKNNTHWRQKRRREKERERKERTEQIISIGDGWKAFDYYYYYTKFVDALFELKK